MKNKVLKTPVDELVQVVKDAGVIHLDSLVNKLKVPKNLIERWLVILEEFHILRLFYKGFDGFVEYKEKQSESSTLINKDESFDINLLKQDFLKKAKFRNINDETLKNLWIKFVKLNESKLKELFYKKSRERGFSEDLINVAWLKYLDEVKKF